MAERKDLIPVGEEAPDFTVQASDGTHVSLSGWRGKQRVVLIFYPGDNTPVCTAQLCAVRDSWENFRAHETVVYGINPAGAARHSGFVAKHDFPFPLLVDGGNAIAANYGCRGWFGLVKRTVYVIDKRGKVAFAQRGNPAPAAILKTLHSLKDHAPAGA